MTTLERSIPIPSRQKHLFTRRTILQKAGLLGLATFANTIPDMQTDRKELPIFSPSQVGWNINMVGLRNNPDMIGQILAQPGGRVRYAVPLDEVWKHKHKMDFEYADRVWDMILKAGKIPSFQLGIKTIGWPEVHAPVWLVDMFPQIKESGAQIDENPEVQKYILEYINVVSQRYLQFKEIDSIQVENEPYSKHLSVSRYRYLSPAFNKTEREAVAANDPYQRPFLQNIPLDSPENFEAFYSLKDVSIIGINVYPQHRERYLQPIPPGIFEFGLWTYVQTIVNAARLLGKRIKITEYQIAAWNNEPFNLQTMVNGLREIQKIDPEYGVSLWDGEKVLASGNKDHMHMIHDMIQA